MGGQAGQDCELWRKLMSSSSSECHAGLSPIASKGFAEAWVYARLWSSKASVATRGLTKPTFLGTVVRWRSTDKRMEAGRTFWGSITLLSVVSADLNGLMGRCWATSTSHLAHQGYSCSLLRRQGYPKRVESVEEGANQLYFHSIQIISKTSSCWFQWLYMIFEQTSSSLCIYR